MTDVTKKQIIDIVQDQIKSADIERQRNKPEPPERREDQHNHKPEEFMPAYVKRFKCPDGNCGKIHENPQYKESEYYCSDCGHAYTGGFKEAVDSPSCPGCGGTAPALYISRPRTK